MSIKPILFNTEMVKAILDGRKTVTRRVVKPQPDEKHQSLLGYVIRGLGQSREGYFGFGIDEYGGNVQYAKPPYQPEDTVYIRETWNRNPLNEYGNESERYIYKSTYDGHAGEVGWHPSIHMPKEAARIWLKVTNVRVERLQDITEEQAVKEGCYAVHKTYGDGKFDDVIEFDSTAIDAFIVLWNGTLKKDSACTWAHNPWVWATSFERCEKPVEVMHG